MTFAEALRVLLFIAVIAAVYFFSARALIGVLGGTMKKSWKTHFLFSFAGIGIVCMLYGRLVEPNWLSVTRVSVANSKIPRGSKIRIAHISDVHSESTVRLEERLPEAIAAEKPDLIVFTGDALSSADGLPVFKALLKKLSKIAPTFAVKGNWDATYWKNLGVFEETGAVELNGAGRVVTVRGIKVGISGLAAGNEKDLNRALVGIPANVLSVFLYHYPDLIAEVSSRQVDLYCAGHTHGGQVALPGFGALVTFSKFGKKYESGLYREGKTSLYVNRGIGMEGGSVPRVRFWARPELTIIDLVPPMVSN
jgi:predicted MPP superfamily phosphohydrolase